MNMDDSYYRNSAIIEKQHNCSGYKSMRKYSSCTEEQVKATNLVEQERDLVKEEVNRKAKAEAAKTAAATATPAPSTVPTVGV